MVLLLLFMCYIIILQEHAQALALNSIFTIKAKAVSGVTLSYSEFALRQDIKLLTNTINLSIPAAQRNSQKSNSKKK
jgi:hypothetical protein